MARIRTIKPEFPQSESMGNVSRDARLCFVMLWTIADDSGRLRGNSRMLASLLFPYDDDAPALMDSWLSELEREGCIARYLVDGATYVEIAKWLSHQKIDKPSPSKIPPFDTSSRILANPRESSALDQGPKDQGSEDQGRENAPRKRSAPSVEKPMATVQQLGEAGIPADVAAEFIAHKASMKAPLTERAWRDHLAEAKKAGWSPLQAAEKVMAKSWKGFEAKYVANEPAPGKQAFTSFAQQAADVARTTVPAKTGRDPVLLQIEEDRAKAVPPSLEVLERMAKLRAAA